MRRKVRFTTKSLLLTTVIVALAFGVWCVPRVYVANVQTGYSGVPVTGVPHPRFLTYRDEGLGDRELQLAEQGWILSHDVISKAVELLEVEGISPDVFGNDPDEWFKQRVVISPIEDSVYMEFTLAHRESSYAGSRKYGRDALAWKAAVALMKSYQSNSYSSPIARPNDDNLRLPTFSFGRVESRLW
jgi:hypothetical protein